MKIGIITFHCSDNYGAVLQAIALTNKLCEMGHEAKLIDYRPPYKTDRYNPKKIFIRHKSILHFFYHMVTIPAKYKLSKQFEKFRNKHMKITERAYYSRAEIQTNPPKFDTYITGSDQVWNPESLGRVDDVYYLEFAPPNAKRISYAPSFGTSKIEKRFWNEVSTYLKKMDAISVRELDGQNFVRDITGIESTHVLDPVFLLDKSQWNEIADDSVSIKEPYLLLYARERSSLLAQTACRIAKEMGLKIINISRIMVGLGQYDKNTFSIGPDKFLGLFKNASVICTNSFHGTAFSIIYEKPFLSTPHSTRNSRLKSLLETLNLSSQMIYDDSQLEGLLIKDTVNYDTDKALELLNIERRKSIEYLESALSKEKD